ncbi:MAG TPA: aspartate/glutamate racemase family protein, partial [Alphaproteobacteria bacterium]|nr:aspartate/glutamate racemase family protein [Alphaproteobacteria bacterium]
IATESTTRAGAYDRAIRRLRPDGKVNSCACSLFVGLAEEGWAEGDVADAVARRYLAPLFEDGAERPDTLVLGCTHFPLLEPAIRRAIGPGAAIVDSADTTAEAVAEILAGKGLLAPSGLRPPTTFLATDAPERFARVAGHFLGDPLPVDRVELVELQAVPEPA